MHLCREIRTGYKIKKRIRISDALPYGKYTLHIKAKGVRNQVSANDLSIDILVLSPFYRKAWFILICILGGILLLSGFFYWRIRNLIYRVEFLT